MKIKNRIYKITSQYRVTKSLYYGLSYFKGKIKVGIVLAIPIIKYKFSCKNPVFLVFTPEHANLGDHAIALSETRMLQNMNVKYHEVTGKQLYDLHQYHFFNLLDKSTILVNGGGNLGTLWPDIEKMNRWMIGELKQAAICILPNSIYYGNNEEDQLEFRKSIELYNSHPNLHIYAREACSYGIMKEVYHNVKLIPDMVFLLEKPTCKTSIKREGCLLCLRDDVERTLTEWETNYLQAICNNLFKNVRKTSTVLKYNVSVHERQKELQNKWREFRKAELVVTDRLHGMIFCAITGTKCIVLDGKSPKIRGCYEWIRNIGYIRLLEDTSEFKKVYHELQNYPLEYDGHMFSRYYKELANDIYHIINDHN